MKLRYKILIIVLIMCIVGVSYIFLVEDIYMRYDDHPLTDYTSANLLENPSTYISDIYNAIATKNEISTGMYTDANYENFHVELRVPSDDPLLVDAWNTDDKQAYVTFESGLQGTIEWIINNKYVLSMYYYKDDNTDNKPIIFYNKKWVGLDRRVSGSHPIPEEAKGHSIYVKYSSYLGTLFFMQNGNDIRYFHNYLTIK